MALLALLSACAQVEIKDHEFIGSLGSQGGAGFHTLNSTKTIYSFSDILTMWTDLSHPMVMTSVDTLTDWKAVIEKLCSLSNDCVYQVQQVESNKLPVQKASPEAQAVVRYHEFYARAVTSTGT